MRETTATWLEPLMTEAERRGIDIKPLVGRASMPAVETDLGGVLGELARKPPAGAVAMAIDWIEFGNLLSAELGWTDYPPLPEDEGGAS